MGLLTHLRGLCHASSPAPRRKRGKSSLERGVRGGPMHRPATRACLAGVAAVAALRLRRHSAQASFKEGIWDAGVPAPLLPANGWRIIRSLSQLIACLGLSLHFVPLECGGRCPSCVAFSHHHVGKLRKASVLFFVSFVCSMFPFCLVPISASLHISFSFTVMSHKYDLHSISSPFSRLCCFVGNRRRLAAISREGGHFHAMDLSG